MPRAIRGSQVGVLPECPLVVVGYKKKEAHYRPCASLLTAEFALEDFKAQGLKRVEVFINFDSPKRDEMAEALMSLAK